jgi:hypothetical protein
VVPRDFKVRVLDRVPLSVEEDGCSGSAREQERDQEIGRRCNR